MNKNISKEIQILINQFNVGNSENVILKGKILIKKNPGFLILYNLVGSAYQKTGDYLNAEKYFKKGLQLEPNNIVLMNNLAMSYKNLYEYTVAEEIYLKIISLNDKYINAYVNLGNLKRDLNKFNEAITLYEKALLIEKKSPVIYYSLALAHQGLGNFEKAISFSKDLLKIDPNFTRADHLISQSVKYSKDNKHYLNLKEKLESVQDSSFAKVDIYFSLAKAEEDIGNIKESSKFLIKGNELMKKLINYDVLNEINLIENIKEKFKKVKINNVKFDKEENVIFILGMPRSGTSLVEQIITSHSEVFGGGELPILSKIIKDNFINERGLINDDFDGLSLDPPTINKLRSNYLNFIKNFKFKQKYMTDKAPLNFRWIGFIMNIFPNAKIIHCNRDPKNNCFSIFKNLFEGGLNFSYNQNDLIKYYKSYLNLMEFWKSKYSDSIFDIKYENLISNSEEEIKKIIKFCNLEWEDNCLSFHNNKTPIKTMSTAQARKPIYKSSIKGFDKFKDYFSILDKNL